MVKKIIIIGGGVSGLTAGIYAQMYGYESLILEKNPVVGGLCTGWNRNGQHIDGCVHWLTGSNENDPIYDIWKTTGVIKDQNDLIYLPSWGEYEYEGTVVPFYKDLAKAEEAWLKISPSDKKPIKLFFKMVRKIGSVKLPLDAPSRLLPFKKKMKVVRDLIRTFPYYTIGMRKTCESFANKFKHPALRWAINHVQPGEGNLYSMMYSYSTIATDNGGIPVGGSQAMVERMKEKYLSLGGQISFNSEVKSVHRYKGAVDYLILKDEKKVVGDYYVACCDSNYTLYNLLDNKYIFSRLAKRYNRPDLHPAPSCVLINYSVPVIKDLPIPYCFNIKNYRLANKNIDSVIIRSFQYDSNFVKNDKTILQVLIDQDSNDYDYWTNLYQNKAEYNKFKKEIAEFIKNEIINKLPELKDNISLLDVATPVTLNRYTNASRGSYMSFLFNHRKGVISDRGRIIGLKNFYLSGQYMQTPGGLPLAAASGRFSIQWIKHNERSFFLKIFNLFRV